MTHPALTDRLISQGRALVRTIEALGTIEPTGPSERAEVVTVFLERVGQSALDLRQRRCKVLTSAQGCTIL